MSDIVFEALKLIVMIVGLLIARYAVPWLKQKTENEKTEQILVWVEQAVLMAQQVHWAKTGEERKQIVLGILKQIIEEKGIQITDEQLDTLIEAAVKSMKMGEA